MLQLDRPRGRTLPPPKRRRRSRRGLVSGLPVAAAAAIVLGLLIAGLAHVGSASRSYWRSVDRSYAAQARVLVAQSRQAGGDLSTLLGQMPSLQRPSLQQHLDALVSTTAATARAASDLAPPVADGQVASSFVSAMQLRARAATLLRTAVDGLLGMSPLSVAGTPAVTDRLSKEAGPTLSPPQAAADLFAVGLLLARSDREYSLFARHLRASIGHPSAPVSTWEPRRGRWSVGTVDSLAANLAASPSLAVDRRVILLANGVLLTPSAVPPAAQPGGSSGVPVGASVLPPTSTLGIDVAVANEGNVGANAVHVVASLQPMPSGRAMSRSAEVALAAGTSTVATLPPLPVHSNREYTLTVSVVPPAGQTDRSGLVQTYTVWVAPSTG